MRAQVGRSASLSLLPSKGQARTSPGRQGGSLCKDAKRYQAARWRAWAAKAWALRHPGAPRRGGALGAGSAPFGLLFASARQGWRGGPCATSSLSLLPLLSLIAHPTQ